jgi:hypothetical protein
VRTSKTETLRDHGLEALADGKRLLAIDVRAARGALEMAIAELVEAFLRDRRGNADLFKLSHEAGRLLETKFGCRFSYDPDEKVFVNGCPIQTLHSRIGISIAMTTTGICSICEKRDFQCDHVPGETYDGVLCIRNVDEILDVDHLALTSDPDFVESLYRSTRLTEAEVISRYGSLPGQDQYLQSDHCKECDGEPAAVDLNPRSFRPRADNAT